MKCGVVEGAGGNREVPPVHILEERGNRAAVVEAYIQKEGGSWGKHGFPHATEPQARENVA
jgi:hypothetical protein